MEILVFIKLLQKNWWKLVLIPFLTVVACYFLVKELPNEYESHGTLSTGLVDKTEEVFLVGEKDQEVEINRKFDNLIAMMKLKKVLDLVSYKLFLHDINLPAEKQLKENVEVFERLSAAEKKRLTRIVSQKSKEQQELLPDTKDDELLIALFKEIGYDHTSLLDYLSINRQGNSDYISIYAVAHMPEMSEFLVNNLSVEFIKFYAKRLTTNNTRAIGFLADFLSQKKQALTEKMNTLREFKINHRVLNLNEQARSLYGQISEYEGKREIAASDIDSYANAIKKIVSSKQQIRETNDRYVRNNFDPKIKQELDALQLKLTEQINESSDQYLYNPLSYKTSLIAQRLTFEMEMELAISSVKSIQDELKRLNSKFDELVPNEAQIQEIETSISIATDEYMEALQRYNDVSFASSFPVQLKQIEKAMLGTIKPSKKILILGMSGIVSFVFVLLFFFVVFYFDDSIRNAQQLANETEIPVLGYINFVEDVSGALDKDSSNSKQDLYRKLLRSIRFEIDHLKENPKIVLFTSLKKGEGKSSIVLGLAKMFTLINKRVLVIDGNFANPTITSSVNPKLLLENLSEKFVLTPGSTFDVIGNQGGDKSIYEVLTDIQIADFIHLIRDTYDVVLIDTESIESLNKVKEWVVLADLVVAVFASASSITVRDKPKLAYFRSLNEQFSGWILNGVKELKEPK